MIKVANSTNMIKLVNPLRMHLNNDDELMVVLNLQEPASIQCSDAEEEEKTPATPVSIPEQKPAPVQQQQPSKKKQKAKAAQ